MLSKYRLERTSEVQGAFGIEKYHQQLFQNDKDDSGLVVPRYKFEIKCSRNCIHWITTGEVTFKSLQYPRYMYLHVSTKHQR